MQAHVDLRLGWLRSMYEGMWVRQMFPFFFPPAPTEGEEEVAVVSCQTASSWSFSVALEIPVWGRTF